MSSSPARSRHPPKLVALAAAASAVVGLGVTLRWVSDPPLALAGLLLVGLAVCLWMGVGWARPVGLNAGLVALFPLAWGVFGLAVITDEWLRCADGRLAVASLGATGYPSGFCATRDWPAGFGTGFALVGVGLAGLLVTAAVVRERHYFAKPGGLAAGALALLLVVACVPAGEPVEFRERSALSSCGEEDRLDRSAPRNLAARQCLLTALEGPQPAEFVSHVLTVEGDPIHYYYRVWPTPDTPVEVFLDARRDRWSRHSQWSHSECRRLEPDAVDVFLTADCEEVGSAGETSPRPNASTVDIETL